MTNKLDRTVLMRKYAWYWILFIYIFHSSSLLQKKNQMAQCFSWEDIAVNGKSNMCHIHINRFGTVLSDQVLWHVFYLIFASCTLQPLFAHSSYLYSIYCNETSQKIREKNIERTNQIKVKFHIFFCLQLVKYGKVASIQYDMSERIHEEWIKT